MKKLPVLFASIFAKMQYYLRDYEVPAQVHTYKLIKHRSQKKLRRLRRQG